MSQSVFGAAAAVTMLNRAFNNSSPANAVFNNQVAEAGTTADSQFAFATTFAASFNTLTDAQLAERVLGNLGVLPNDPLLAAVADYFAATGVQSRGIVVLQLGQILAGLENATGEQAIYAPQAVAWNKEVEKSFLYSSNTANTTSFTGDFPVDPVTNPGQTFTLTTGVDTIVGTSGDDTINASNTAASLVLGGLDSVDGGAGNDTLNIADTNTAANQDFAFPAGFTVKNVENLSLSTNGAIGTKAGTAFDISGLAGLTKATLLAAGAGSNTGSNVKAAGTTDVALTVSGNNQVDIAGGKAVSVVSGATGTGTVGVIGSALTAVTVKGGGVANIDNTSAANVTATGTTMTAVTLDGIAGATATVKGGAVANVTLQNQKSALAVTMTNATSTALTVNANGVGYDATGAGVAVSIAAGAAATTLTVNATGTKSNLTVTGAASKTLNITGDAALTLAPIATVTKLDGSAATGALSLGTLNAVTVDVKTGSGNDVFTATTTNKITVDAGAGNDTVTLSGALVVGSNVNLGAGNDKLIGTTAVVKAGAGITDSVIDGGDGVDTVSAALINAGNAGLFKNFEGLSLNSTTGLDAALLTGSTLTALSIDSVTTNALYQNLSVAQVLDVSYVGDNSAFTNTLSFKDATGTADTFAIKFTGDNSAAVAAPVAANVKAGTIAAAGIENFTVESGGTKAWNSINLTGANAKTVVVTGASNLDLTFASFGTSGATTGVSSIDGSAATGKLSINVAGVAAAAAGLTVKGGSAADTLTASTFATSLAGGAGADTFNVAAAVVGTATPAGAVITSITDAASTDKIVFANQGTEVFTTTKIDVSTATALIGGTVNALDLAAAAADSTTHGQITWFQYGGNTYVVQELGADAAVIGTDDIVVKLTGLIDLSTASYDAATNALTLA